jgi:hypothetical protein
MGAFIPYQSTAKLQNRLTNYFLYTKIHNYMIIKMGSLALIKAGGEKKKNILLGKLAHEKMGAFIPNQSMAKLQNRLTNKFEQKTSVVNASFLFFETSKLWALFMYILYIRWKAEGLR